MFQKLQSRSFKEIFVFALVFAVIGGYFIVRSFAAAPPSYNQVILGDHPVAFWAMDNPSGTEPDLTGNGNTGTYKGGTPLLATMINGDQAADFNGASEYMTVPSKASMSIATTHELTWEAWINPATLQYSNASSDGYVDWMGKCANYSPSCEWESRMYSTSNPQNRCNRLSAYAFNSTAGLGSGADWQPVCGLLQSDQWLYVVGEYQTMITPSGCSTADPGTINIWVNGVEWDQAAHAPTGCMSQYGITPTAGNSPLNIGTMALDTWFKGSIGKVAIYNYLLSQSQIDTHFQAMTGALPSGSCSASCTIPVPTQTALRTTTPPSVGITSPTNNATVSGLVTVSANASDNLAITKVEFYDDGTLIGSSASPPYSYTWNTSSAAPGTNTLTAKAYDSSGNVATSVPVTVDVTGGGGGNPTPLPSTPTGLTSPTQTDDSINLSWNPSTSTVGIADYKVYRYGSPTSVATVTGTSFTDTGLAAGTQYSYTVSAVDTSGDESSQSAPLTVSTKPAATPPPPPSGGLSVSQKTYENWGTGYCSAVTITNNGGTVNAWTLKFTVQGQVTSLWNAAWSQSGGTVTISNKSWDGTIKAGQSYDDVGFCASLVR